MRKKKLISSIASTSLAVVLAAFLVLAGIVTDRETPSDPLTTNQALASPIMLVSPDDSNSENNEGDNKNEDSPESDRETISVPSPGGEDGSEGTNPGGSNPSDPKNPPTPKPGIETNLGTFRTIGDGTKPPDMDGRTIDERSGFDKDKGELWFYAAPNEYAQGYTLEVAYQNSEMPRKKTLTGNNGIYSMPIIMEDGADATVTLTLLDRTGSVVLKEAHTVSYIKNEGKRHGPKITHTLIEGHYYVNKNITFSVSATDYYTGATIYSNRISVAFVGEPGEFDGPSPTSPYQYTAFIAPNPIVKDPTPRTIRITATDDFGVTTKEDVHFYYKDVADGEKIGDVTVQIDLTTVGLGVVNTITVPIYKGNPFPRDLYYGLLPYYTIDSSGSFESDFYIKRLSAGGMMINAAVPEQLWKRIVLDKINADGRHSPDSLGQFDYTGGSGWLYRVTGSVTPQVSLSGYYPTDGDIVTLIFTLNNGKDVGGSGPGALPSYCGTWMGGVYTPMHDYSVYVVSKEPTCVATGKSYMACSVEYNYAIENGYTDPEKLYEFLADLGAVTNEQDIPMIDHPWVYVPEESVEPTDTLDGYKFYRCPICGITKQEVWPATG